MINNKKKRKKIQVIIYILFKITNLIIIKIGGIITKVLPKLESIKY